MFRSIVIIGHYSCCSLCSCVNSRALVANYVGFGVARIPNDIDILGRIISSLDHMSHDGNYAARACCLYEIEIRQVYKSNNRREIDRDIMNM